MVIYVDVIITASSSSQATNQLLQQLHQDFAVEELGNLDYFLGIEVTKAGDGLILTQRKYIGDLLR